MKIGLLDVDGHNFPNLALMKISRYFKSLGHSVEWYTPFGFYDRVYMSKVFSFTPDYTQIIGNAKSIFKGGGGYDIKTTLPEDIDRTQPDYSIYPYIDKSLAYGFLSRGCIRKCPWCIVPVKEGYIRPYMDIEELAIEGRTSFVLMDNNLLACGDYAREQFDKIIKNGFKVDLNQANDARLVDDEWARTLAQTRWINGTIRFGCDTKGQIKDCADAIERLVSHGFKGNVMLYTMIYGDIEECYKRVTFWKENDFGVSVRCQSQPMLDFKRQRQDIPQWQKDMARWSNQKGIYASCDFKDYRPRRGFKCDEYFK